MVFAGAPGLPPVVEATAAALPAARAAVTVAAAAITLVRLRMRILLQIRGLHPQGTRRDSGRPKKFLIAA
jgi:hypothetical protein